MIKVRRNPDAGFTLLETIIALAILGMIGVLLANLFAMGTRASERGMRQQALIEQAIARRDLRAHLYTLPIVRRTKPLNTIMHVRGDELIFFIPDDNGTKPLVLMERDNTLTFDYLGKSDTLWADLTELNITFYGRKSVESRSGWHTDWTGADLLPRLIKIESRSGARVNPTITIEPARTERYSEMSLSSLVPPG